MKKKIEKKKLSQQIKQKMKEKNWKAKQSWKKTFEKKKLSKKKTLRKIFENEKLLANTIPLKNKQHLLFWFENLFKKKKPVGKTDPSRKKNLRQKNKPL